MKMLKMAQEVVIRKAVTAGLKAHFGHILEEMAAMHENAKGLKSCAEIGYPYLSALIEHALQLSTEVSEAISDLLAGKTDRMIVNRPDLVAAIDAARQYIVEDSTLASVHGVSIGHCQS